MLNQLFVEKKNLKVEWIGINQPKPEAKDKRPSHSVQFLTKTPEGHTLTFYAGQKEPFVPEIKIGDSVNAEMKVRAYKDGLYCDLVKHEILKSEALSKLGK
jgi:hypothetical protein